MKKIKVALLLSLIGILVAGCGLKEETADNSNPKKITDDIKVEIEDEDASIEEERPFIEKNSNKKTDEELDQEYEDWVAHATSHDIEASDVSATPEPTSAPAVNTNTSDTPDVSNNSIETPTETPTTTNNSSTTTQSKYNGLAVANWHDVTLPAGIDYNSAIEVIKEGVTSYPDVYPYIDGVKLNIPGEYTGIWVKDNKDGTYTPYSYTAFKVTITRDYTGPAIFTADDFTWSLNDHQYGILDTASKYVHYYGNGTYTASTVANTDIIPAVYDIVWTSTDGVKYTQQVTITE